MATLGAGKWERIPVEASKVNTSNLALVWETGAT